MARLTGRITPSRQDRWWEWGGCRLVGTLARRSPAAALTLKMAFAASRRPSAFCERSHRASPSPLCSAALGPHRRSVEALSRTAVGLILVLSKRSVRPCVQPCVVQMHGSRMPRIVALMQCRERRGNGEGSGGVRVGGNVGCAPPGNADVPPKQRNGPVSSRVLCVSSRLVVRRIPWNGKWGWGYVRV